MESSRKERILAVAERLFRHYGPQKTTVADIAREADVAIGSVYLDFASKEAIVDELSQKRVRTVAGMMRSAADGAPAGERLCRMLKARVAALLLLAGEGAHACDLVRCFGGGPVTRRRVSSRPGQSERVLVIRHFDEDTRALLRDELTLGNGAGEYACDVEPTLLALEVAFAALAPPHLFAIDRHEATELAERLSAILVDGIRRR